LKVVALSGAVERGFGREGCHDKIVDFIADCAVLCETLKFLERY
jgi:hypothetical protein